MKKIMEEKINGLAIYDNGARGKTPVVFIHGFPFDHTMWEPQIRALGDTHRVISYDVRGHGKSESGDGQYTIELFVDDLMEILSHLRLEPVVLCGLSMGGYIALRAVERHADRFKGLVLCDTKAEADSNEAKIKRAGTVRAIKKDGVEPFAKEFIKSVLTEKTLQTNPKLVESTLNMIRGNKALCICGALLALAARTDTTASLVKMNLPTLILVGGEDKLTPPSVSEAMSKSLPHAEMHVIPAAAHLSNLENPVLFNEKLLAFLKKF